MAYLNFADLDLLFLEISFIVGLNTFFLYLSKRAVRLSSFSGRYLDGFDLFVEKLLKKYFTILSSIEWKLTIKILPPGFKILVALIIPLISSVISLLTKILKAWKVFVLGLILVAYFFFYSFQWYQLTL